jgi:hypothetical protein
VEVHRYGGLVMPSVNPNWLSTYKLEELALQLHQMKWTAPAPVNSL